jgi:maltodextrin utilization protein YvdJ
MESITNEERAFRNSVRDSLEEIKKQNSDTRESVRESLDEIKEQNADTRVELGKVGLRLDTLNGSVARHQKDIQELQLKQATATSSERTRREVSKEWWERCKPFVYLFLGILLTLILKNGPDLVKGIKLGG